VFLTGGDQLRLCAVLADTVMETIRLRVQQRNQLTLAGTSAGAAVMGHHMIAGGGSGAESFSCRLNDRARYFARGNCRSTLSKPESDGAID